MNNRCEALMNLLQFEEIFFSLFSFSNSFGKCFCINCRLHEAHLIGDSRNILPLLKCKLNYKNVKNIHSLFDFHLMR
jgi:hypothetical protein